MRRTIFPDYGHGRAEIAHAISISHRSGPPRYAPECRDRSVCFEPAPLGSKMYERGHLNVAGGCSQVGGASSSKAFWIEKGISDC